MPTLWTVLIDIAAWLVIHFGVSWAFSQPPATFFNPDHWLMRERAFEKDGRVYKSLFKVKAWKGRLPDGAALFKKGFRKKKMAESGPQYVELFIRETCRAEATHWVAFFFAFIFFIWNLWWVGLVMVVYAVAANAPCIITQRYNRIRFRRVLRRLKGKYPAKEYRAL